MILNPIITATDLAQIIQLSVAPVFLLAGIAGFLNVMSGRLGRIVDRARVVGLRELRLSDPEQKTICQMELRILWRRAKITNWSIGLCTAAALLVCTLIVSLFVGGVLEVAHRDTDHRFLCAGHGAADCRADPVPQGGAAGYAHLANRPGVFH